MLSQFALQERVDQQRQQIDQQQGFDPFVAMHIERSHLEHLLGDSKTFLDAVFGDQIQLLGYGLKREGDVLKIDLAWKALRNIERNYKVFAHVFDPQTETIVAQWDAMPRNNAYPTSRWIAGEVVTETLTIPLTNVLQGDYRIALGLYEPAGRLPASGTIGVDADNQRVILEEDIRP